jgi:CHASE1-domain containing sensor protein
VHLADVAELMGVPVALPSLELLPTVGVPPPPLKVRQQETRLMMLLGVGFGLGIALTLNRLLAFLVPGLNLWMAIAAFVACILIGLLATVWVVNLRSLLHDRSVLDRWSGDVTSALRSVVEELVATRVLMAESVLTTALSARDESENAQVADQVSAIDTELREYAIAAARAAAARDREMPTVQAALDAVRAELGKPGIRIGNGPGPASS